MRQQQTTFENIVGKEEIARNEQCFLLHQIIVLPFVCIFDIISLFAAKLEEPEFGISDTFCKEMDPNGMQFDSFVSEFNTIVTHKVISGSSVKHLCVS